MIFNEYPYLNLQDVNLDYILKMIKELQTNLHDFVKINTIKYADPIIWNITKQYEKNTVVLDGSTGTAYLSVNPVPTGVGITNTDYWTVIFTLDLMTANQNITLRDDGTNVISSFPSDAGDWLLWNFNLYKATRDIPINTAYVVGYNITRYTVDGFVHDYLDQLLTLIGSLNDLNTSNKTSVVNAINSVLNDLNAIIGALTDLNTSDDTSIVNAINSLLSDINTKIGDINTKIGDLTTLNTTVKTSVVDAINSILSDTIGDLTSLDTGVKSSVVGSINSIFNDTVGDLTTLDTTDKSSVVNAINENYSNITLLTNKLTSNTIYSNYTYTYGYVLAADTFSSGLDKLRVAMYDAVKDVTDKIEILSIYIPGRGEFTNLPRVPYNGSYYNPSSPLHCHMISLNWSSPNSQMTHLNWVNQGQSSIVVWNYNTSTSTLGVTNIGNVVYGHDDTFTVLYRFVKTL